MIATIILFLLLLSLLVLAHEWGHYIVARKSGMTVEEFGFGFPPRIFSFKRKDGMIVSVNIIPLGGFVRIKGESGEDYRGAPDSFASKSLWRRFCVLIAGVGMNLVVAFVLFSIGFMVGIPTLLSGDIPGATITNQAVQIFQVSEASPAAEAGLAIGDEVVAIDDQAIGNSTAAIEALRTETAGEVHTFTVVRAGEERVIEVTAEQLADGDKVGFGVAIVDTGNVRFAWWRAPWEGLRATGFAVVQIADALVGLLGRIVTNQSLGADVSGPVGIAVITGQVARLGIGHLIQFAAMLSVNLAVLNAFPFPALDGGRIVFLLYELVARRRASPRVEQIIHGLGFALLILLVLVVTFKDVARLVT